MDFKGCQNIKSNGLIAGVATLKNCLQKKGWHVSSSKPSSFKAGYPMVKLDYSHASIATTVSGDIIYYSAHSSDACDKKLEYKVYYIYP